MRKTSYRLDLLKNVASLFSLNRPLFEAGMDIEASARQSYVFKTYLKGDDIAIRYKGGVVLLTGTVFDKSHTLLARETVASLPGVTRVQNKLEEHGAVPFANPDMLLMTKVKSTLLLHQNVNGTETEVSVKNGTVILRGMAATTAQKNLTTEYAKDVEGVKRVKNEMEVASNTLKAVEKKTGQQGETTGESIDDISVSALVRTALLHHRSTSALGITVETRDGVVKLEGKTGSWEEKNLVTKRVIDVPGVKMVFNNMTVVRIADKPTKTAGVDQRAG
jgi:hyperosmotically inducible periplasmic protein